MDTRQPRSRIEKIRIDTLRVPPPGKAQRPFREAKGDKIAAEFDINNFGFPVICQVEGTNWTVDGQHRVYAIQKCGYAKGSDSIECEVYNDMTMAEMAVSCASGWRSLKDYSRACARPSPGSGRRKNPVFLPAPSEGAFADQLQFELSQPLRRFPNTTRRAGRFRSILRRRRAALGGRFGARMPVNAGRVWLTEVPVIGPWRTRTIDPAAGSPATYLRPAPGPSPSLVHVMTSSMGPT